MSSDVYVEPYVALYVQRYVLAECYIDEDPQRGKRLAAAKESLIVATITTIMSFN